MIQDISLSLFEVENKFAGKEINPVEIFLTCLTVTDDDYRKPKMFPADICCRIISASTTTRQTLRLYIVRHSSEACMISLCGLAL